MLESSRFYSPRQLNAVGNELYRTNCTMREYISRAWIAKSLQDREKEVPAVKLAFVESDLVQMGLQLE